MASYFPRKGSFNVFAKSLKTDEPEKSYVHCAGHFCERGNDSETSLVRYSRSLEGGFLQVDKGRGYVET